MSVGRICGFAGPIAAACASLAPAPAQAETGLIPIEAAAATQLPELSAEGEPAARVTLAEPVGRLMVTTGQDAPGAVRYGARQGGETSGQVRFTSTRPRPGMASAEGIGTASLPVGLPLARGALTSRFGARRNPLTGMAQNHAGVDLAAPTGSPVRATGGGVVRFAGAAGNYGLLVVVDHGSGVHTRYAHLSQLGVRVGQSVSGGDIVGLVGSTGRSTGPHLHYEVRLNGRPLNPM